ncbi:MAG TPA: hypothetical protein PLU95_09405, partial [Syntrophales bacterium]|nr:hypothetical protein [Syntrophales bacterium]
SRNRLNRPRRQPPLPLRRLLVRLRRLLVRLRRLLVRLRRHPARPRRPRLPQLRRQSSIKSTDQTENRIVALRRSGFFMSQKALTAFRQLLNKKKKIGGELCRTVREIS